MTIVSTSNRWLNRLYKTIAILLVLVAVLISAFRLFLPYVEHYRGNLEDYINERNDTQIAIGALSMTWQRFGPILVVDHVRLIDGQQASASIDKLEVKIDFWGSIRQQRLISSNLVLTGAKLTVEQGLWQAEESPNMAPKAIAPDNNSELASIESITNIFLNRLKRFSVRDSEITINNKLLSRHFHINNLNWLNNGDVHKAQGSVVINGLSSNNIQIKAHLTGEQSHELTGQLYLEANHLDITPWLDSVLAIENDKTKSDISFSAWLNVNNSAVNRMQIELAENTIDWYVEQQLQTLKFGKGQLLLVKGKKPQSFKLFSTQLSSQFNQQKEQPFTVMLNKLGDDFSAHISAVDLSLAGELAPLLVGEKTNRKMLSELALSGTIDNFYLKSYAEGTQILADFSNVSNHYSQGIPKLDNISGQISFSDNVLHVGLHAAQGALDFQDNFVAPIPYNTLATELNVAFNDDGWRLNITELAIDSPELQFSAQVHVDAPSDGQATMALLADITGAKATNAGHYYPLKLMSKNLVSYLNNALQAGTIEQAQVLVNGPLANFPFTDGSGIFVVDAELRDSRFKFAKDWPAINDFSANLNFTNNSMLITGRQGDLTGLDVTGVRAAIDDLARGQVLTVNTVIKPSQASVVSDLMSQSPLRNSVGSVLDHLNIRGDISGEFYLNLPLKKTDEVIARGKIDFSNNQLALQQPRMDFTQVNGQLTFENDNISTEGLSLYWQGMPLALAVSGENKSEYYNTEIEIEALWQEAQWQAHVPDLLKKYAQGVVPWQGKLSLHQHHQGGFSYDLSIDSSFQGTQLNLPIPYTKIADDNEAFSVTVTGQLEQSTINVKLGQELSFFGVLAHKDTHFTRSHLVLGDENMLLPMDGFHITTNLAEANFTHWQPLISDIITAINPHNTMQDGNNTVSEIPDNSSLFAKPERIRGTIGKLNLFGETLDNVSFNLLDESQWWLLQLNATQTRSQLKFYPNWLEQGVDINAEFIHLLPESQTTSTTELTDNTSRFYQEQQLVAALTPPLTEADIFSHIPPIRLRCDRCQIADYNFGQVDFLIERNDDVIELSQFKAKREQAELHVSGMWQKNNEQSVTSLTGDLSLKNIEYELSQLGYASIIRDSGGELNFNVDWQSGPHNFDVSQLNGKLNVELDDGYLADVSDKARIFSVLSLQSLVRKLTLDFRDIFSDGMFYSDIKGDYIIENGVLSTQGTTMNGTAGNLFMTGNTDLTTGGLDYQMSYKPNLTSSLPVLAWIATLNPVTFLAGVAIDQVIKSQVVSEFKFELTGNLDEPNFRQVDQTTKEVSVGRSKPPEIVEAPKVEKKSQVEKEPDFHLKQYPHSKPLKNNKDDTLPEKILPENNPVEGGSEESSSIQGTSAESNISVTTRLNNPSQQNMIIASAKV